MKRPILAWFMTGVFCLGTGVPSATLCAANREDERIVRLYQRLAPATVLLSATYEPARAAPDSVTTGVGAGFMVESTGTLLTNAHVVEGAKTVTATLFDGTHLPVEVLAIDSDQDIAIARLPADHVYPSVVIGDSDALQVGQQTLVVGSPFGLGFTLSSGLISGLGPPAAAHGPLPPTSSKQVPRSTLATAEDQSSMCKVK